MVEGAAARVDFATAEALAFGTLMLHHRVGPREAGDTPVDPDEAAALGLNLGHYGEQAFLRPDLPATRNYCGVGHRCSHAHVSTGGYDLAKTACTLRCRRFSFSAAQDQQPSLSSNLCLHPFRYSIVLNGCACVWQACASAGRTASAAPSTSAMQSCSTSRLVAGMFPHPTLIVKLAVMLCTSSPVKPAQQDLGFACAWHRQSCT